MYTWTMDVLIFPDRTQGIKLLRKEMRTKNSIKGTTFQSFIKAAKGSENKFSFKTRSFGAKIGP